MTERLYQDDSYATTFSARAIDALAVNAKPAVILDKTLFYPESGGQLCDTGIMNDIPVLQVFEDNGVILHVLEREVKTDSVECRIDWKRRFDHMQQHTGQHILSQCIKRTLDSETISFALGSESATIDIDKMTFSLEESQNAEEESNKWIYKNVPIHILYPTDEELADMPLRKKPPAGKKTRIIRIEGLDFSPCGGTHCNRTGEVGMIKINRWEKIRGKIRLEFYCGSRALKDYQTKNLLVHTLSSSLSVNESALIETVQKFAQSNKSLQKDMRDLRDRLFNYQAQKLFETGEHDGNTRIITHINPDSSIPDLQLLAQSIRNFGTCIIALVGKSEKPSFVITCTDDAPVDVSVILSRLQELEFHIKGGGGKTMVQGGLSPQTDLHEFINAAKRIIIENLQK